MNTIIELLKEKNHSLEKFFRLNEVELENFSAGNFNYLERFYTNREGLLQIIKKIDEVIERSNEIGAQKERISGEEKRAIISALTYKNDLVNRILEQDLTILTVIEAAKSKIIKELRQVQAAKKVVGKYKSDTTSGRLDEEA